MRSRAGIGLLAILLVVMTCAATVFWFVARDLTSQAATEQVESLLTQSEDTAFGAIQGSIADIDRVSAAVSFLAASGAKDDPTSDWAMYHALEFVPELSGVYIAGSDGSFNFVFRTADGFATKRIVPDASTPAERVMLTERDSDFSTTSFTSDPDDSYEPRERDWYKQALESPGEPVWTDPYTFFTSGRLGITQAISSPDGSWVVGVDVELDSLVWLLNDLSEDTAGEVFLFDGENTVLSRNGLTELNEIGQSGQAQVRDAVRSLSPTENGLANNSGNYDRAGQTHTVSGVGFDLGLQKWFLITDISAADVAVPIAGLIRGLQALALSIVGAAVLAIVALIIPATKPIARLEREASIDQLTSLPNRRTILHRGEAKAIEGTPMSVAMVDADRFKLVNDSYGHAIGDEVLRGLADRFLASGCDVGRLGGEEFVIILPGDSRESDAAIVEALRADIAAAPFETAAGPIPVTVSIGLARHHRGQSFTATLGRADAALLEAKLNGRNQVTCAHEPVAAVAGSILYVG